MINTEDLRHAGSVVLCSDGTVSHAGGRQGACSHHGGIVDLVRAAVPAPPDVTVRIPVLSPRIPAPSPRIPSLSSRNLCVAIGLGGAVLLAVHAFKARRDAQQQTE